MPLDELDPLGRRSVARIELVSLTLPETLGVVEPPQLAVDPEPGYECQQEDGHQRRYAVIQRDGPLKVKELVAGRIDALSCTVRVRGVPFGSAIRQAQAAPGRRNNIKTEREPNEDSDRSQHDGDREGAFGLALPGCGLASRGGGGGGRGSGSGRGHHGRGGAWAKASEKTYSPREKCHQDQEEGQVASRDRHGGEAPSPLVIGGK